MLPQAATQPTGQPFVEEERQPVRFELTEQTRQAVDDYLRAARKKSLANICSMAVVARNEA